MSTFILHLFDLWTAMDRAAVQADPLFNECHPVFTPNILDALQLPNSKDLARLQKIQKYIQQRVDNSRRPNIFSPFDATCFAYQYLASSSRMQNIQKAIQEHCATDRVEKEAELDKKVKECDELTASISGLTCVCLFNGEGGSRTEQDIASCRKCFFWRTRNRVQIKAFEEYLPDTTIDQAGIVFELCKPRFFEAYRNATWRLIRDITYPTKVAEGHTPLLLRDFQQLEPYIHEKKSSRGITLASTTKSFTQSHFGDIMVRRCSTKDVLLPFGPRFQLWDEEAGIWVGELDCLKLTIQHHCSVSIPQFLKSIIPTETHPPAVINGPSSYQLMANQRQCPHEASLHEFSAYQRLLYGTTQRWINILAELGSSNLNLSSRDTTRLLAELAVQVGPASEGHGLRDSALVFQDPTFCDRLAKLVGTRLISVRGSWREHHCMDLLITLSESLHSLAHSSTDSNGACTRAAAPGHRSSARSASLDLIRSARKATLGWIQHLREEARDAKDASTAERLSTYAFRAAILCRRTFNVLTAPMSSQELSMWCLATIALQEFMPECLDDHKAVLIRDTKMTYNIAEQIEASVTEHPSALSDAISQSWGCSVDGQTRTSFSDWTSIGGGPWLATVATTTTSSFTFPQTIQFNYLEGYLLVDGQPLGKLSYKIRNAPEVKELFGNACLRTFPSNHDGMSYRLAGTHQSHIIHFGLRDDQVIIHAVSSQGVFEFVPRGMFSRDGVFDFPASLIEDKVHWLNLSTKCLIIRPRTKPFKARPWDWSLDLVRREFGKYKGARLVGKAIRLVDPNSVLGHRIAKLFQHFESPEWITAVHTSTGRLAVDLNRLDLSFDLTRGRLLYETKLKMQLDLDQDAGCLYGLESKIILKDTRTGKRSILVPLGSLSCRLAGPHVQVKAETSTAFARFDIDPILGRLTCAPEPPLVFALAHFHAITSFPIPDPLTSKIGIQASFDVLQSGAAQPWTPLSGFALARLKWIAALAPEREFYPKDLSRLQRVRYNTNLTAHVQHDLLAVLANDLIRKSQRLQPFFQVTDGVEEIDPPSHLCSRGIARWSVFEQTYREDTAQTSVYDKTFRSRCSSKNRHQALNVIHISELTFSSPLRLNVSQKLEDLLRKRVVGGFPDESSPPKLSDLVEGDVAERWGSLVEFSRSLQSDQLFGLAFRLGLLAYDKADDEKMNLLRILVAIGRDDALRVIPPPAHPVFIDFGINNYPEPQLLEKAICTICPQPQLNRKKRAVAAEEVLELRREEEIRRIARFFSKQWPANRPSIEGFHPATDSLIDVADALEAVDEIWQKLCANRDLHTYVDKLQDILNTYKSTQGSYEQSSRIELLSGDSITPPNELFCPEIRGSVIPSLSQDLLGKKFVDDSFQQLGPSPRQLVKEQGVPASSLGQTSNGKELRELQSILLQCKQTAGDDSLRVRYISDLQKSLNALCNTSFDSPNKPILGLKTGYQTAFELGNHIQVVRSEMNSQRVRIIAALSREDARYRWLRAGDLWPGIDTISLLKTLRSNSHIQFGCGMKAALVRYGLLIVLCQWLVRVRESILNSEAVKFQEYLTNTGHEQWDPMEYPDWLLMEIDCDIIIRDTQMAVARQIISPSSGVNSVFQLMMGKHCFRKKEKM